MLSRLKSFGSIDPYLLTEGVQVSPGVRAAGAPGSPGAYYRGELFAGKVPQLKPDTIYLLLHAEIWFDEDEIEDNIASDDQVQDKIYEIIDKYQKEDYQRFKGSDWRREHRAIRPICPECGIKSEDGKRLIEKGPGCTVCLFTRLSLPSRLRAQILEAVLVPQILNDHADSVRKQVIDAFKTIRDNEWRASFIGTRGERIILSPGVDLASVRRGRGMMTRQPISTATPAHGADIEYTNKEARHEMFIEKVLEDLSEDTNADDLNDLSKRIVAKYTNPVIAAAKSLNIDFRDEQPSNIYQLYSGYMYVFEHVYPRIFSTQSDESAVQLDPFNMIDDASKMGSEAIIYSPERVAKSEHASKKDRIAAELFGHYRNMWNEILEMVGEDKKADISEWAVDTYLNDWEVAYINAYVPLTHFARRLFQTIRAGRYEYAGDDRVLVNADLEGLDKLADRINPFGPALVKGSKYVQDDLKEYLEDVLADALDAPISEIEFHNGKLELHLDLETPEDYWTLRSKLVRHGEEERLTPSPEPPDLPPLPDDPESRRIAREMQRKFRRKYEQQQERQVKEAVDPTIKHITNDLMGTNDIDNDINDIADSI